MEGLNTWLLCLGIIERLLQLEEVFRHLSPAIYIFKPCTLHRKPLNTWLLRLGIIELLLQLPVRIHLAEFSHLGLVDELQDLQQV